MFSRLAGLHLNSSGSRICYYLMCIYHNNNNSSAHRCDCLGKTAAEHLCTYKMVSRDKHRQITRSFACFWQNATVPVARPIRDEYGASFPAARSLLSHREHILLCSSYLSSGRADSFTRVPSLQGMAGYTSEKG